MNSVERLMQWWDESSDPFEFQEEYEIRFTVPCQCGATEVPKGFWRVYIKRDMHDREECRIFKDIEEQRE